MKCISGVLSTIVLLASLFVTAYCPQPPVSQVSRAEAVPSEAFGTPFILIITLSGDEKQVGLQNAMKIMEEAKYTIGSNEILTSILTNNAYCPLKSKDNSGAIHPVAYKCFSFDKCINLEEMVNQTVDHVLYQVKQVKELKDVKLDVIVSFGVEKKLLQDKNARETLFNWKNLSKKKCDEAIANSGFWGCFTLGNIAITAGVIAASGALGVLAYKKPEVFTVPASKIQSYGGAAASWLSTKCTSLFSRTSTV